MPIQMIATARYKKVKEGEKFTCSNSDAKALSALGMATYIKAEMKEIKTKDIFLEDDKKEEKTAKISKSKPE